MEKYIGYGDINLAVKVKFASESSGTGIMGDLMKLLNDYNIPKQTIKLVTEWGEEVELVINDVSVDWVDVERVGNKKEATRQRELVTKE